MEKKERKERDGLAKPGCLSSGTEHCSKQPAPPPFSRPVPAGGHRRGTPENRSRPVGGRGERSAAAAAAPGARAAPAGATGKLHSKALELSDFRIRKGGTENRGRRQSKRRASLQPKRCCWSPCPLPAAAGDLSPPPPYSCPRIHPFRWAFSKARPKQVLPGPVPGRSLPLSTSASPAASFLLRRRPGPPAPSARWPAAVLLPFQTSLLDSSSLTARELLQFRSLPPNRFTRIGMSRRARLRFPAPARGGRRRRRPPPQVGQRQADGPGPGEHLAPSQFSYGEILRQCLLR